MLSRGGTLIRWMVRAEGDATWTETDVARAGTLEARWKMLGVSEEERRRLIPCAVWKARFPGLVYPDEIMKRLEELAAE
jgi:hypothetical protein